MEKKNNKRSYRHKNLTGEDIDMLREREEERRNSKRRPISDWHEDAC